MGGLEVVPWGDVVSPVGDEAENSGVGAGGCGCGGRGFVYVDPQRRTVRICACATGRPVAGLEGAPARVRAMLDAGWAGAVPRAACRDLGGVGSPWALLILGAVGAGKTHLAALAASQWSKRWGVGAQWLDVAWAFRTLRNSIGCESYRVAAERARSVLLASSLVVLDEANALTGWERGVLADALYDRHSRMAATIVTANIPVVGSRAEAIEKFGAGLGERIVSRLFEGTRVIVLQGQLDRRIAKRREVEHGSVG